jgi:integrase
MEHLLDDYLELRHKLGFKMVDAAHELHHFVRFAQQRKSFFITVKLALEWATRSSGCHPAQQSARLRVVRRFAEYLSAIDPRTEVPPKGLLPYRNLRKPPYFYSDPEVGKLVQAAQKIPSPKGLRSATYSTLFGLLAVTGMRLGETIGLDLEDVDLEQGILNVRLTKSNKMRRVPVHATTLAKLRQYRQLRDQTFPNSKCPSFLLSEQDTRLTGWAARRWFIILSLQIGLRSPSDHCGPRIHDLRHRFVIKTLCEWYRAGQNVESHLPELSTYIGHGHVRDTYWYISATPELLLLATKRLEQKQAKEPS